MLGFKMVEKMSGFHQSFIDGRKRFMEFLIEWGPNDIWEWLNPFGSKFMKQPLSGYIWIDNIGHQVKCDGTLTLAYHKGEIIYDIYFDAGPSKYHYVGKKTKIRPWNLLINHTTCKGNLYRIDGENKSLISNSVVYFNFDTIKDFIRSFRFVR